MCMQEGQCLLYSKKKKKASGRAFYCFYEPFELLACLAAGSSAPFPFVSSALFFGLVCSAGGEHRQLYEGTLGPPPETSVFQSAIEQLLSINLMKRDS